MSYETISDASRSATHHPLKSVHPMAAEPSKEMSARIDKLEEYIENYVQPLAESVQMLVTRMHEQEARIGTVEKQMLDLKELTSENDKDFISVFKTIVELKDEMEVIKSRLQKHQTDIAILGGDGPTAEPDENA